MSFEDRFQKFLEVNGKLQDVTKKSQITLTIEQLRQICRRFWDAGKREQIKQMNQPSLFELIFGKP